MSTPSHQGTARIKRKTQGLGASIYGGRPTFALRKVGDEFSLYELLPEDQAVAHQERWQNNRKINRSVKIVDPDFISESEWEWDGWKAVKLAKIDRARFDSLKTILKNAFTDLDDNYTELVKPADTTILLPEDVGVKLALAFIGVERLRRVDKQRAFAREIERMSTEECYYWHSLCRSPSTPNGSKALRTLHTDHIG